MLMKLWIRILKGIVVWLAKSSETLDRKVESLEDRKTELYADPEEIPEEWKHE